MDRYQWVTELWDRETHSWNVTLLRRLFSEEDTALILAIRISPRRPRDALRWKFSTDGNYTVRLGYRKDFSLWWNSEVTTNPHVIGPHVWNNCWSLNGRPRLLTLLWRLMDNNIPVRENLKKRGIVEETLCPLFHAEPETVEHLFLLCPGMKRLMRNIGYTPSLSPFPVFALAWEDLITTKSKEECGKVLAILWGVWKARNLQVFEEPSPDELTRTVIKAIRFCDDYVAAQAILESNSSPRLSTWTPPPPGTIKINMDAGVVSNGGGQVSAIARDDLGRFIQAAVKIIPTVQHPTLLEAYGTLLGLELAKELACVHVCIESDCLPLILALRSGAGNRSDLGTLIDDCLEAARRFDDIQFNSVRREANTPAHLLAKMQGPFSEITHYFAVPPDNVRSALEQDVLAAIGSISD